MYLRSLNASCLDLFLLCKEMQILFVSQQIIQLKDDNPGDILKAFCGEIFNDTSTTIVHLINPFKHSRSLSAQYVSNLISHVGLPVITWGPEYEAASSKVRNYQNDTLSMFW